MLPLAGAPVAAGGAERRRQRRSPPAAPPRRAAVATQRPLLAYGSAVAAGTPRPVPAGWKKTKGSPAS